MEEEKLRTAKTLVKHLANSDDPATLAAALSEIRANTRLDPAIRLPLADAGAIRHLSNHLLSHPPISSPSSHEHASAALLNLSISAREPLMSTPNLLAALAYSLRPSAPAAVAQNSAAAVFSLLSVDTYRPIIGSNKTLVSSLIALLRMPRQPARTLKDALKALFGVALYPLNRARMVELGVVPAVFGVVFRERGGVVEDATAVIAQVAGCWESVEAFRRAAGFVVLVELVEKGGRGRVGENAVAALLNLAMSGGEEAVGEIREVEEAEEVVREFAEEGVSARGKRKAEALLRVLGSGRRGRRGEDWIRVEGMEEVEVESPPEWCSSGESNFSSGSY